MPWFMIEIIKTNLEVSKRILDPNLPIDPKFVTVKAPQLSELGKSVLANCITLTPGTYSVDTDEDSIEVHALTSEIADDVQSGELIRRIAKLENTSGHS